MTRGYCCAYYDRQMDRRCSRGRNLPEPGISVDGLRVVFRGLTAWRNLFDQYGDQLYTVTDDRGIEWELHEVERLYRMSQEVLTKRQAEAIKYFLVDNMREEDVAIAMGIKSSNPIGLYATEGLRRLVEIANDVY